MIQVPLNQLKPAKNNVRKVNTSLQSLNALAASIQSQGLLHNLVIRKNGKGYEVIDGNRRLEALKKIYGNEASNEINCVEITENENEVGLHANMMRENMHPLDESDVIYALCAAGEEDYDSVGKRFGQTNQWVKQRVALSELSEKAKEMFRNYEINMGVATALTLGSHEQQDRFLDENKGREIHAHWVRREMTQKKIPTSAALFNVSDPSPQVVADLGIESDLFSDEMYITNLEKFDEYQNAHIDSLVQKARASDYQDVVYLRDEYWFDSPQCRGWTITSDETVPDSDCILVISYNSYRYTLDTARMVSKEELEQSQLEEKAEEEEVEITPILYSEPQKQLLHGYYATEMKKRLWEYEDPSELTRLMMAIVCHRKLGYTYSYEHRIGNVIAEFQSLFPKEEYPDDYAYPDHENYIDQHIEAARQAFDNDGVVPLDYCLSLPRQELSRLFSAICLTAISKHDCQNETFQNSSIAVVDGKWFKPDAKWLNKYKSSQLDMLSDFVIGKVISGSKRDKISALKDALQKDSCFDPYGEWPQFKE